MAEGCEQAAALAAVACRAGGDDVSDGVTTAEGERDDVPADKGASRATVGAGVAVLAQEAAPVRLGEVGITRP